MPELVTIAVYVDPIRAQFARMLLEREDIPCFLLGEHLTNQGRAAYAPEGGVSVQVAVENAATAMRFLQAEGAVKADEAAWEGAKQLAPCPQCGSANVVCRTAYAILSLVLYLPFWGNRYQCRTCGHCWK